MIKFTVEDTGPLTSARLERRITISPEPINILKDVMFESAYTLTETQIKTAKYAKELLTHANRRFEHETFDEYYKYLEMKKAEGIIEVTAMSEELVMAEGAD